MVAVAAGCSSGAPRVEPPGNVAAPGGELAIDPAQPMGSLAIGVRPIGDDDDRRWSVPIGDSGALALVPAPFAAGQRVVAVPRIGASVELVAGAQLTIRYGCDGGALEVVPLAGAKLAPGIAWVVPEPRPTEWSPAAVPMVAGQPTPELATWTAGPIAITSTRIAPMHATLRIAVDGREVASVSGEKQLMDGAEPGPIDLRERQPGVAELEAVYEVAANGPWLVVLMVPGYEGSSFVTHLVGRTATRELESLGFYLYSCAF